MIHKLASSLIMLKKEFQKNYDKDTTPDILPVSESESFPIKQKHLETLHNFAEKNPIYRTSYPDTIYNTRCIVYEGDINRYWFGSIGHKSSRAPFSPTWLMSGYVLALLAKKFGFASMVDIGSGDGRIAFCSGLLGMNSFSIEIDDVLADLQNNISDMADFNRYCFDATTFDYSSLGLQSPIMMMGGLAQMGGLDLAASIMEIAGSTIPGRMGWAFAGTHSPKYAPDPKNEAGWGTLIEKNNLAVLERLTLPTAWTLHEHDETPYIFTVNSNPN